MHSGNSDEFPARMVMYNVPAMPGSAADYPAVAKAAVDLRDNHSTPKLRNQGIKLSSPALKPATLK
jgi:hypothetical protein